ncbi:MAG: ATP-binding cassette domain-containing protein [Acholeplasma sp.]|nr:ATP-binding cassette domain-containing protein [Acholeplasma sp.]
MSLIYGEKFGKLYLKKELNLSLSRNEVLLIKGNNGVGKTTLVKLLIKYIKNDFGFLNNNTKKVYYLEENVSLPEWITACEYISIIEKIKKQKISYILDELFDIPKNVKIRHLSKGNKQKLALLTVLVNGADLYILDEPSSGLDKGTLNEFVMFLKDYFIKGQTLVIISHDNSYDEISSRTMFI